MRRKSLSAASVAVVADGATADAVADAVRDTGISIEFFETGRGSRGLDPDEIDCLVCADAAVLDALRERFPDVAAVVYAAAEEAAVDDVFDASAEFVDRESAASDRLLVHAIERAVRGDERPSDDGADAEATAATRSEAHLQALADAASDAIVTIDANSEIRYVNPAVEEVFGYAPEELIGESLSLLMSDEMAERHREGMDRYLRSGERALNWDYLELPGRRRDGSTIELGVSFSEFRYDGDRLFTGIIRDVTEQVEHQRELAAVAEVTQGLSAAETRTEICEAVVDAAEAKFDAPAAMVALYDESGGELRPVAESPEGALSDELLGDSVENPLWETFATYEPTEFAVGEGFRGFCVPLGKHGVVVWTATGDDFTPRERDTVRILAEGVRAALDRADREESLRERTSALEARTASLDRTAAVADVLGGSVDVAVSADSEREVLRGVCERITAAEPFAFAWVGEDDPATEDVIPTVSAGEGEGYLEQISVTVDESPHGQGPAGRALQEGTVQTQNDVLGDPPFDPWRQAALEREFRSVIAVPIRGYDVPRRVLVVYATEPDAFGERERRAFGAVGDLTGYALGNVERRRAIASDSSTELELRVGDDVPPVALAGAAGTELEFERVCLDDDGVRTIVLVPDGAADDLLAATDDRADVRGSSVVDRSDGSVRIEVVFDEDGFFGELLERNALPRDGTTDGDGLRLVVELPSPIDVDSFVRWLRQRYDAAPVARRELDRPVRSRRRFRSMVESSLTDRQNEVLEAAFYGGYFDWPRERTGQEIADTLGVSQPTVNRHLRAAERKLLTLLFDEE
ncbi:PAS domain S-box protein [Halostella sp. JP-L12]|uniref:PAS domain S-box protein n=1 Tax=Halostella TaxID=1843185 RepID=UPI000EF76809|nr:MULTISPECIES: PAS domain S-box protein [Halostella]NHN49762.1 PAS domain S-box protein [Halostella sp. JP-L12]NHN49899.1 PAS domain S-box protein [Halostella sp. JP-L12]